MKSIILLIAIIILPVLVNAQGLTKNAEGESSILFHGSNIGLDIGKTQLTFGINNLNNTIGKEKKCFFGASAKGENKEGLSNLFSTGDLVPETSLEGYWGYSFSNGTYPNHESARKLVLSEMELYDNSLIAGFKNEMISIIKTYTNDTALKYLRNNLLNKLNNISSIDEIKPSLSISDNDDDKTKAAKKNIKENYDNFIKEDKKIQEDFQNQLEKLRSDLAPKAYWQLLIYGYGGIKGSDFKRFIGIDNVNPSKSFVDEYFRGGKAGLGINYQINNMIFGFTYSYFETNNFSLLSKKEYSLKSSITQNGQTLTEDKKITAYSGSYGNVAVNELNFDFILNLKLDKEAKNHVLINPYLYSQLFSRNYDLLPNSTNVGCGFYFFQQTGKFLGGIYIELTDINNNYEKAKPTTEQILRPPLKRLTFGIVGKVSLNSILNIF